MLENYMNDLIASRQGLSSACLAERGEKTEDNPFGFGLAKTVSPDEVVVLSLAGGGNAGANYRNYNGYLKHINEYVEEISAQVEQPVRSVVAVVDFGKYHSPAQARKLCMQSVKDSKKYKATLQSLPLISQQEYISPQYVKDIFNSIFLDRISTNNGTQRISGIEAAQNIRKVNIMTYCHGGYVALKLEDELKRKMTELGYKKSEQKNILKQLFVLSYAPDCPLGISQAQTISFSSATDYQTNHGLKIKDYLQYYEFGVAFFPDKMGNVFYCTQIDKCGIEGNPPPVYKCIDPNEWFTGLYQDKSDDTSYLGEHEFMGFRKYDNMSRSALQMRSYMRRIFKNALVHSCKQKEEAFTPLPSISRLAADDSAQRMHFFKIKLWGYRLWTDMQIQTKLMRKNFSQDVKKITLD